MAPYPCGERGGRAPRECFLAGFFFFGFSRVSCVCPSVRRRLPPPPPPCFFFFPAELRWCRRWLCWGGGGAPSSLQLGELNPE